MSAEALESGLLCVLMSNRCCGGISVGGGYSGKKKEERGGAFGGGPPEVSRGRGPPQFRGGGSPLVSAPLGLFCGSVGFGFSLVYSVCSVEDGFARD